MGRLFKRGTGKAFTALGRTDCHIGSVLGVSAYTGSHLSLTSCQAVSFARPLGGPCFTSLQGLSRYGTSFNRSLGTGTQPTRYI